MGRAGSSRGSRCLAALVFLLPSAPAAAQSGNPVPIEVCEATVLELQQAMEEGRVTSAEIVDAYIARIRAYDQSGPELNAILSLNPRARVEAAALDEERARSGPRGPLHGIPVLLKDNFDAVGMATTAGSFALAGMVPPDDAYVVRRLREAGAVLLGKTNMHELSLGITTVSSSDGQTRNPYDLTRNPGGSSGGTGVAVASSLATLGYGTDTCGSIRIPSSFNALFGLRPTKGLVSSDGVVPVAHTLDVSGPLARSVTDLAIGLDAVVGYDPADPSTAILDGIEPPRFVEALHRDALKGVRIGVITELLTPSLMLSELLVDLPDSPAGDSDADLMSEALATRVEESEVDDVIRAALDRMRRMGAKLVEVEIPGLDNLMKGPDIIDFEFKSDLGAYLAWTPNAPVDSLGDILARGLYHPSLETPLRRRDQVGSLDTPEYREALAHLAALRDTLQAVFDREGIDVLAYPTMRRGPAFIGRTQWGGSTCLLAASSGFPAITMPAGYTADGLPVGLELLGHPLSDATLVGYAYAYERAVHPRKPPASVPPLSGGGQ